MKALDLLRADHRQLASLFEQARAAADPTERYDLFSEIRDRLESHSEIEEQILYPELSRIGELEELISESEEDHRLMREILAELSTTSDPDDFSELFDELIDTIEDHVAEEESEIFPRMIQALPPAVWEEITTEMLERREPVRDSEAA